jgi:glycosyltransferase involved in cell wall biosynthesis
VKVSIIITNYNYQDFVKECIDSCLNQTYNNIEIIVVDDGSTDDSSIVLNEYQNLVKLIFQKNAGMVEASNTGYKQVTGDLTIFLDADDFLLPEAVEKVVFNWVKGVTVKTHFRLEKRNNSSKSLGLVPAENQKLSEGDVWSEIVRTGDYNNVPTSGNVYSSKVLDKIFPILGAKIGNGNSYLDSFPTDAYLKYRIPYFGSINAIQEPLGVYRIHGNNNGVKVSPYLNQKKRKRILFLAKTNTEFINSKMNSNNFLAFYKRVKVIRLMAISFKVDRKDTVFGIENKFKIYSKLVNLLVLSLRFNILSLVYNFTLITLIIFLPSNSCNKLLNKLFLKR